MKKILLFFFLLVGLGHTFGQQVLTSGTAQFFQPTIENPYGPNDQINFDFFATNNSTSTLFINPSFELLDGEDLVYEPTVGSVALIQQLTDGSIVFQFPDNCTIPDGEYQLRFVVNYSQSSTATSPVTYTTKDDDLNIICNNQDIPAETPYTSEDCEVYVLTVEFNNNGPCCTLDPVITLTDTPFYPSHPWKSCKWWVRANIDWGANAPLQSNVVWNTGVYGTSLLHPCGTTDYSVTLNWMEGGEWCSKESDIITVVSRCYCIHEYPPKQTVAVLAGTSIIISPNPNDGQFNFILPLNQTAFSYEVWNSSGVMILEQSGIFENTVSVDLGDVEPGIYLLTVHYELGTTETVQFIVQ